MVQKLRKTFWQFLRKLNFDHMIQLLCSLIFTQKICKLSTLLQNPVHDVHSDLFKISQTWKT